jgi:hypothetical protein
MLPIIGAIFLSLTAIAVAEPDSPAVPRNLSEESDACLECHATVTPGIVGDWERSRHAGTTLDEALAVAPLERRVSVSDVPDDLGAVCVGCAECHLLNPEKHRDTFDHNGYTVHTVVTPEDCASCHPVEAEQFAANLMSAAHGNLMGNPLHRALETAVNGLQHAVDGELLQDEADALTRAESCLSCHGTRIEVQEQAVRETSMGDMEFPVLAGWPNQGVGRVNPDSSRGACSACHTRHQFAVAMARQPATCRQCHKGPDVPAYPVYEVSKHGNLYDTMRADWDFDAVPWVPGRDFTAPTCAACHIGLLTDGAGEIVAQRTHRMNDRLAWRLFGLPYAHPHPLSADTTPIHNRAGMPLPTELSGEPVFGHVIDATEMTARRARLEAICGACHAAGWVAGHFDRLEHAIATTNDATLTATHLVQQAWDEGLADGPDRGASPFDEGIERMWTAQWLFHANSTRFASAMGGADYGVFAGGRWDLARNLRAMQEWLELRREIGTGR